MPIRFQFQPEVAVQAVAYLLGKLGGSADKVKLMKLLYLADKAHFLQHGRPITGDAQWALPHGPVPSCTLNLLSGGDDECGDFASTHIGVQQKKYSVIADPGVTMVPKTGQDVLNATLDQYGSWHTWSLRDLTHKLPEYLECAVPDSSAPIPYEVILRFGGDPNRYRRSRPVVLPDMAAAMLCPFPASESDL